MENIYLTKGLCLKKYYGTRKEFEEFLKSNDLKEYGYPNGR